MDYYQGVVTEYLRADRSVFVNTECCIQLNDGANPDASGPHWYCDAVAVDHRDKAVYLCEVSYSKELGALLKRLAAWNANWTLIKQALSRDCSLDPTWPIRAWLFIPGGCVPKAVGGINRILKSPAAASMPAPKITKLEAVAPWHYPSWNRFGKNNLDVDGVPETMR